MAKRTSPIPFLQFNSSPEIVRLVVMMYVKFPLSLRPDVRRGDSSPAGGGHAPAHPLAMAPGRGLREDQRRNALPLAGCRSRGGGAGPVGRRSQSFVSKCENSHQPLRRRERAMLRFRQMKSLQKFASVHASLHNHFNTDRHLTERENFKAQRSAALAEWKSLIA
jgi:hypothetical protein